MYYEGRRQEATTEDLPKSGTANDEREGAGKRQHSDQRVDLTMGNGPEHLSDSGRNS